MFLFCAVAASGGPTGKEDSWNTLLAFTLLGGNWWVIFRGWPSKLIFPHWSISAEERFYLVWPPLVRRLSGRQLLITGGLMLVTASLVQLHLVLAHALEGNIWCNTFARLDAIAVGIIAAVLLGGRTLKLAGSARCKYPPASRWLYG